MSDDAISISSPSEESECLKERGRFFDGAGYVVVEVCRFPPSAISSLKGSPSQVENVLHRLPKNRLEMFSDVFKNMLSETLSAEPTLDDGTAEKASYEDIPVVIENCTNFEFESLLDVIYPSCVTICHVQGQLLINFRRSIPYPRLTKEQLLGALKVATMWKMKGARPSRHSVLALSINFDIHRSGPTSSKGSKAFPCLQSKHSSLDENSTTAASTSRAASRLRGRRAFPHSTT